MKNKLTSGTKSEPKGTTKAVKKAEGPDEAHEKKWRTESDFRVAQQYKEMAADRERMRSVKEHARKQVKSIEAICKE